MLKLKISILLLAIMISACSSQEPVAFECDDPLGCVRIIPGDPVKIVSMQALSGSLSQLGREYVMTMQLAAAEMNNQIHGHPIEIIVEDEGCTREGGFISAQKVITDPQVVAVHGTTCSISSVPASEILSRAGKVLISGCSTAPSLTGINQEKGEHWQPGFFRTAPNDTFQGTAAALFSFQELSRSRAATVSDGGPYTRGLVNAFEQAFVRHGGQVVFSSEVNRGDQNMEPLLEAVVRSGADILFFPIFSPEGDHIVRQAREITAMHEVTLVGADGLLNASFVNSIGEAGVGMYLIGPLLPQDDNYHDFVRNFYDKFGVLPQGTFNTHNYDAAVLLLQAVKRSALQLEDGSMVIKRQALRDEIRSTENFPGLTGTLNCDHLGDCGIPSYKLVRIACPDQKYDDVLENIISTYIPESTPEK